MVNHERLPIGTKSLAPSPRIAQDKAWPSVNFGEHTF
jgi:hypothetical protein